MMMIIKIEQNVTNNEREFKGKNKMISVIKQQEFYFYRRDVCSENKEIKAK